MVNQASDLRILLLEDDDELRETLSLVLEDLGYPVETAADSQAAIASAAQNPPDIFIADVKMKGADGLETLAILRRSDSPFQCMVITGYATEADSIRAIKLGVGDYLRKPFSVPDFEQAVERLASRATLQRQLKQREGAAERLLGWALELVSGSLDLWKPQMLPRVRIARAARQAARLLGHSSSLADNLGQAVLLCFLRQMPEQEKLAVVDENLSAAKLSLSQEIETALGAGKSASEVGLLGAAMMLACQPDQEANASRDWLAQRLPEEQAIRMETAIQNSLEESTLPPVETQGQEAQSLLTLGRALQAGGDWEGAQRAYLSILAHSETSEEGAEALLQLARMPQGQAEYSGKLLANLPSFPPLVGARVKLELACPADSLNPSQRSPLLREAQELHSRLGLRAGAAQAQLALWTLGEMDTTQAIEAFRCLLEPAHCENLLNSVAWLVPPLLEQERPFGAIDHQTLLARLVRESPRCVTGLIRSQRLSAEGLGRLLDCLEKHGCALYREALEMVASGGWGPALAQRAQTLLRQDVSAVVPLLRLQSFGGFAVSVGDSPVGDGQWGNQKARFLLACLACQARPVDQEILQDQFWPEYPPERARRNLYQAISLIRKAVRPAEGDAGYEVIVRNGSLLSLNRSLPTWNDFSEWQRLLKSGEEYSQKQQPAELRRCWTQAYQLYAGPYLQGCYMDWAVNLRNSIEQQALQAFSSLAQLAWEGEDYSQVVEICHRILNFDPCRQPGHLLLMEAFMKLGRPEEAVRQFDRCRHQLQADLGLEPETDILRSYHKARLML